MGCVGFGSFEYKIFLSNGLLECVGYCILIIGTDGAVRLDVDCFPVNGYIRLLDSEALIKAYLVK